MIRIKKIDHVAVAVGSIDAALEKFGAVLGLHVGGRELVEAQKTEAGLPSPGPAGGEHATSIELIEPKGNEGLARFLEKRGPGLHHIAVEVEGIEEALQTLSAMGIALIDTVPRIGARGHKVAFIHPKATGGVLIELVEPQH